MARSITIAGVPIRATSSAALIRWLDARRLDARQVAVGFVNHNFVVACRPLATEFDDFGGVLLLNDGVGVAIAARLVHGRGFAENMNGTDFVPRYLRETKADLGVYCLGGTPDVVARAAAVIGAMPRCRMLGHTDGFSVWANEDAVVRAINAARPDVLLVGFGNPRQERWILANRRRLDVGLIFAVGALFEWMTGSRRRAPGWVRRCRLEWVYRLALEPRRLMTRYTIDVVRFFRLVGVDAATRRRPRADRIP